MRQTKTLVVLTCDAHDGEVEADETVSFTVGDTSYEMELCAEHRAQFHEAVSQWTAIARPVQARRRRTPATAESTRGSRGGGGSRDADDSQGAVRADNGVRETGDDMEAVDWGAVRSWAIAHGYEVSARGRVAKDVLDAYLEAQQPAR